MTQSLYGAYDEKKEIWVFVEHHQQTIENVSIELLAKGRDMANDTGWPLVALVAGSQVETMGEAIISAGADRVLLLQHPLLKHFCVDSYAAAMFQIVMSKRPSVLLLGATTGGRDLAGRLAVRLRTGLNADCTDLRLQNDPGILVCEVSGYGGGVLALIEMTHHRPQMATVRPGVFAAGGRDPNRHGEVLAIPVELSRPATQANLVSREMGQGTHLSSAAVVVAGGRGMDGNFSLLRQLAGLLDAEVGATRPPVDEGHIGRHRQIGQTGVVCRPEVAIACGASGAFHFVVGIQEADTVIAINNDPLAPIFDHADYAVVADAHQVVPALIEALSNADSEQSIEPKEIVHG